MDSPQITQIFTLQCPHIFSHAPCLTILDLISYFLCPIGDTTISHFSDEVGTVILSKDPRFPFFILHIHETEPWNTAHLQTPK